MRDGKCAVVERFNVGKQRKAPDQALQDDRAVLKRLAKTEGDHPRFVTAEDRSAAGFRSRLCRRWVKSQLLQGDGQTSALPPNSGHSSGTMITSASGQKRLCAQSPLVAHLRSVTAIAFGWIGLTIASASVVRKP